MQNFRPGYIDGEGAIWGQIDQFGEQRGCKSGVVWVEEYRLAEYERYGWKRIDGYGHSGISQIDHGLVTVTR